MNKRKTTQKTLFTCLLSITFLALIMQVYAQKENKPASVSPNVTVPGKYLVLNPDQLKILGFESNTTGLFYKNTRVDRADKGVLCLYFTEKVYCSSILLKKNEAIPGHSAPENILKKQKLTEYDFYPVVVANLNGSRTQDFTASQKDPNQKLLPVQVNMADLKLGKRKDVLVFWFKPTEALKESLKGIANVDGYIQALPANK